MSKIYRILLCSLLICLGLLFVGCSQEEPGEVTLLPEPKVDASEEILQLAQHHIDETKQFYTSGWHMKDDDGNLAKIKILDSEITNLQVVKRVDVYDKMVSQRVLDGIQSAYDDFYIFSFRLLPDEENLKTKNLSFELDEEGWISFEEIMPYTSDTVPGPLFLIASYVDDKIVGSNLRRATEFSESWFEAYENERFIDYDEYFTETAFSVIDEYSFVFSDGNDFVTVGLGQKDFTLPGWIKETGKKRHYTDHYADYLTRISYQVGSGAGANGREEVFIETLNYNMPDTEDALAKVIYIGTNSRGVPQTYRGIAVGDTEEALLRLYPDDLYYLDKETMSQVNDGHPKKDIFDYAYFYFPEDQTSRDITFYISEEKIAYIEMISAYERRYVYDDAGNPKNLVNKPANKKSAFQVETAGAFSDEIELSWDKLGMPERTDSPYIAQINLRLPKVAQGVSNGEFINRTSNWGLVLEAVKEFQAGNFNRLYEWRLARYSIDYQVYQWKGAAALVLDEDYGIVEAGGGRHRTVWYYDCDTGNILSARQYAKKCGISEDKIIKQYNDNTGFGLIHSVYEANFYIDGKGNIITFENYST